MAEINGAEYTISGIRPQVAQTMVSIGIEFGDIATRVQAVGRMFGLASLRRRRTARRTPRIASPSPTGPPDQVFS